VCACVLKVNDPCALKQRMGIQVYLVTSLQTCVVGFFLVRVYWSAQGLICASSVEDINMDLCTVNVRMAYGVFSIDCFL
jgi:hypothetical protein